MKSKRVRKEKGSDRLHYMDSFYGTCNCVKYILHIERRVYSARWNKWPILFREQTPTNASTHKIVKNWNDIGLVNIISYKAKIVLNAIEELISICRMIFIANFSLSLSFPSYFAAYIDDWWLHYILKKSFHLCKIERKIFRNWLAHIAHLCAVRWAYLAFSSVKKQTLWQFHSIQIPLTEKLHRVGDTI